MKATCIRMWRLIPVVLVIGALICPSPFVTSASANRRGNVFDWSGESKAYGYLLAYSYRDKVVYHTPIITQKAPETSFNDEEYVFQTETVLKLESAFQKVLEQRYGIRSRNFTFNARVVYKSESIAQNRFFSESGPFRAQQFKMVEVDNFTP